MQHADVRMIQTRDGFCFALKPLLANRIGGELRRKNLDGDVALQPRVPRAIHFSHPTCAEGRRDFVGAKMCAWRERHKLPRLSLGEGCALFYYSRSSVGRRLPACDAVQQVDKNESG